MKGKILCGVLLAIFLMVIRLHPISAQTVGPDEFYKSITQSTSHILLDVRTPTEFLESRISGAINIDYTQRDFRQEMAKLDKSKHIFIYCLSGGRSSAAASIMRQEGFQVSELVGGLLKWNSLNLPVVGLKMKDPDSGLSKEKYWQNIGKTGIYVVDFYAPWCISCQKMAPYLEKMQTNADTDCTILKYNVDEHPQLVKALKIEALPKIIIYHNGQPVWEKAGFIDEGTLRKAIHDVRK